MAALYACPGLDYTEAVNVHHARILARQLLCEEVVCVHTHLAIPQVWVVLCYKFPEIVPVVHTSDVAAGEEKGLNDGRDDARFARVLKHSCCCLLV